MVGVLRYIWKIKYLYLGRYVYRYRVHIGNVVCGPRAWL